MNGESMLALQQFDTALEQIGHRRSRLAELAARNAAAAAHNEFVAGIADARSRIEQAQSVIDETEHASAELTAKRARLEAQLKTIIAPREAEALMNEIALINDRRGELDDRELAALEAQAAADEHAVGLAAGESASAAELALTEAALAAASELLDLEHAELSEARAVAAAALPAADVEAYEHARARFAGVAISRLDGMRCGGCHLDISRGEVDMIKALPSDELAECPQCGRFLVR